MKENPSPNEPGISTTSLCTQLPSLPIHHRGRSPVFICRYRQETAPSCSALTPGYYSGESLLMQGHQQRMMAFLVLFIVTVLIYGTCIQALAIPLASRAPRLTKAENRARTSGFPRGCLCWDPEHPADTSAHMFCPC